MYRPVPETYIENLNDDISFCGRKLGDNERVMTCQKPATEIINKVATNKTNEL